MSAQVEQLRPDAVVTGLVPGEDVTVVAAKPFAGGAQVTYRHADGRVAESLLYDDDLARLTVVDTPRRWTFDADATLFRLVAEARRIELAHLFDPLLAVHLSKINPLPHQIRAVYGEMLRLPELRFLLADDPGAGKTIMAGLLIKELMLRGDVARCLVVAPGGLVTQWQDELAEKFDLGLRILTRADLEASYSGDVFSEHPLLIARLDHLSRNDELVERVRRSHWDLVVVDEAHRMAAHYRTSEEVEYTKRYRLGQALAGASRHFLLMTATPHAGKDPDFQLFMALLDADRFAGRVREGTPPATVDDLMRRMVKEQLLTFEGKPLFPERTATTLPYPLSDAEKALYGQVTEYVAHELNRADRLRDEGQGRRGNRVGFALTVLQRRLASSPEAIHQSLRRRRIRLETRLAEERARPTRPSGTTLLGEPAAGDAERDLDLDDLDDLDAAEQEQLDEELVDEATAARTLAELEAEIATLSRLEDLAEQVRRSGEDRKWVELRGVLQAPQMRDANGSRRKLIVFTEHRDTLNYLQRRIADFLGRTEAVVAIHGGTDRRQRQAIQERFRQDDTCLVLVATDAAGEGLNLQRANLLVNYDLPWNPNRIEQRFGRVHRIGQTETCHLWNLVAYETREGQVYRKLLDKIDEMRDRLGKDQVWDVLGEALPGRTLREMLVEAIRYGDRPEVQARLEQVVDARVGEGLPELIAEHALAAEVMSVADVERIRADMAEAQARRLQPHYVRWFFEHALATFGGRLRQREPGRFQIDHVPFELRHRSRRPGAAPVGDRYERVTFEQERRTQEGAPLADLLAPGHPLLDVVVDAIGERHGGLLAQGSVLVDDTRSSDELRVLVFFEHTVADAREPAAAQGAHGGRVVSQRVEYVEIAAGGPRRVAAYAPYLDYRPATTEEAAAVRAHLGGAPFVATAEQAATGYAMATVAHAHLDEVRTRTLARVAKVRQAVHDRLTHEINRLDRRARQLREQSAAGKTPKMSAENLERQADDLARRRTQRLAELAAEEQLRALPPVVVGAALVVPAALVAAWCGAPGEEPVAAPEQPTLDTHTVERRAVDAVLAAERALGREPVEMPPNNPGYDLRSPLPGGRVLFIEVKGRIEGADTFAVTHNEVNYAGNVSDDYVLAMVRVSLDGPAHDEVRYLRRPYGTDVRLPLDSSHVMLDWQPYWQRGEAPS